MMNKSRIALLVALLSSPTDLWAKEYVVQRGDVLEISIVGMPDLKRRATVNPEGRVTYPLVGEVEVVGSTLPQIRQRLREVLPTKLYQQRSTDGRDIVS